MESDVEHEEREFLEASEEYAEAEAKKKEWSDTVKHRLKVMLEKRKALVEAREGKTSLGQFAE